MLLYSFFLRISTRSRLEINRGNVFGTVRFYCKLCASSNALGLKCFKRIPERLFHRRQETQNSIWTMEMLQRHKTILVAATFCGYEKSWHNDQPCKKKCTKNYCLFLWAHSITQCLCRNLESGILLLLILYLSYTLSCPTEQCLNRAVNI